VVSHCWARHHFGFWWIYLIAVGDLLPWILSLVYVQNSTKIAFWTFSPWWMQTFASQRTANAWMIRLFWSKCLVGSLFTRTASLTSWFHHGFTFLSLCDTPSRFYPYTRAADEAAAATLRPLCIPGALGTRKIRCLEKVYLTSLSTSASHHIR